ncbi:MAG TPA: hypothetical protein VJ984_11140 [Xanthomonadales bacterium]|nr:hypothetical protein [Xanthomonadales bacterium]
MLVKKVLTATIIASLSGAALADTVDVTSSADDGAGTYRAAIAAANADSDIDTIEFNPDLNITLLTEIEAYTGSQDLMLIGRGSTLVGGCADAPTWDGGLFTSYSAADIAIYGLNFEDSCNNGVGVFLPEDARGNVKVSLYDVSITGARFHGLFVDGQDSTGSYNTDDIPHPDCTDPHPYDSRAGIMLTVDYSHIDGNGTTGADWLFEIDEAKGCDDDVPVALTGCPADFDGIRVDDGDRGSIIARVRHSTANGNLADGIEYDERGPGAVRSWVDGLDVLENGETEAFELDNICDEGEVISDLDDGFDIDEADGGDLYASFRDINVSDNRDEGLDLDEGDDGSAFLLVNGAVTNANEDQGIKLDEDGDGKLSALIHDAVVNDSLSQNGMEFTEEDDGSLWVRVSDTTATGNDDAAIAGEQQPDGTGRIQVLFSDLSGNGDPSFDVDPDEISVNTFDTLVDP